MKINGKEINLFDESEDNQELLRDHTHVAQLLGLAKHGEKKSEPMTLIKFANIYFVVKQQFLNGEIKMPYHEGSFCKVLKEKHNIEVSINEMIELRDYFDNYYSEDIKDKILSDYASGMTTINLKKMGLE